MRITMTALRSDRDLLTGCGSEEEPGLAVEAGISDPRNPSRRQRVVLSGAAIRR